MLAFLVSLTAFSGPSSAGAAIIYQSQSRTLFVERTTFPPFGSTVTVSDLGSFALTRSASRLVLFMGIVYQVIASASIDSEMNTSHISASGSLGAAGIPASAAFPPEITATTRVEIAAAFTVDVDTPFSLIGTMLALRSSDRFGIELQDGNGNYLVRIDKSSPPDPIAIAGTLSPGQYSFHYLAELKSGTFMRTDYSVTLTIPAPGSVVLACLVVPATRRVRPRVRVTSAKAALRL